MHPTLPKAFGKMRTVDWTCGPANREMWLKLPLMSCLPQISINGQSPVVDLTQCVVLTRVVTDKIERAIKR